MKMKALGIVRRIDNLGRIVIPKEVRDTQGWSEGTPMEIYMSEEGMVIRQYRDEKATQEVLDALKTALLDVVDTKSEMAIAAAIDHIEGR